MRPSELPYGAALQAGKWRAAGLSCQGRAWVLVRGPCPARSSGWVCGAGLQLRGARGSSVLSRAASWPQV